MPTSANLQLPVSDSSNVRKACWYDYRERALNAGKAFIKAVDEAVPAIRQRRFESESLGRVPDATVQAMVDAGVFRTFTPMQYGGLEIDPASFFEGIMKVGEADSSAAWIAGQLNCHAFEIALMDKRMQDEFWANGPDTRASSSYAPIGRPEKVEGGYLLNGTWTFSSGVDHAQWVILGGAARNFVVPVSDVSIDHGSWDVSGLKGTGSKAVTLRDVFVPSYRIHELVDTYNDANPGWEVNNRPLYWMSFLGIFNSTATNTVIGTAMCGINTFIEQSRVRLTRQGTGAPIAQNPFLHLKLADVLTKVGGVRERHLNNWKTLFDTACQGEVSTPLDRMRVRFESADGNATCFESIASLWPIAGAAASASDNILQQVFRDLMAARNHGSAGRELAAGQYIKTMFGMEPAPFSDFGTLAYYK
ncbi:acyl-CoA dehydrogenase [Pseudomonas sp. MPC6]|uniref:acyl-CoA dehydrogenase n=1 Tax=unclassified Pseudomonas TaxID=196821 RepID=UPI00111000B1|nr:acyl-CoA dehydrogenase [Pseudomonas sp. MPC6]QCY14750.1 acyl-CoA dehydrogenase [Pseudomonas sp. MPC6]